MSIEQQVIDICYSMPSIGWNEGWSLSARERERIIKTINKYNKQKAGDKTDYM